MDEKNSPMRIAQFQQAEESTEAAIKHDLPHMDKTDAYYNGFLDGFYRGVQWQRAHPREEK